MLDAGLLAQYTKGRLDVGDSETARHLAGAVAAVRRWCGWHVTPEEAHEVVLDGPGGQLLRLPTLRLVELTTVVEDGVAVDLDGLEWSRIGLMRKKSGAAWTDRFGGIVVTMTHGFAQATDFEAAALSIADRTAQAAAAGGQLVGVGPFRWAEDRAAAGSAFTMAELAILETYRMERPA